MHKLTGKCCYIWAVTVNSVTVANIQSGFVACSKTAFKLMNYQPLQLLKKPFYFSQVSDVCLVFFFFN